MPLDLEHKPTEPEKHAGGLLDDLRATYDAIDNDQAQTEVFDVEGSRAAVRYRRMRQSQRIKLGRDTDGEPWEVNAQFLIEACDEILVRDPDTDQLEPLIPGKRVTFDWRPDSTPLHEALERHEPDIRRSVLRLFQGVDDALLRHAERVDAWMGSVDDLSRERFAGG